MLDRNLIHSRHLVLSSKGSPKNFMVIMNLIDVHMIALSPGCQEHRRGRAVHKKLAIACDACGSTGDRPVVLLRHHQGVGWPVSVPYLSDLSCHM